MLNKECYQEKIMEITNQDGIYAVAVSNGFPVNCNYIECSNCDFSNGDDCNDCFEELEKWLEEERKESEREKLVRRINMLNKEYYTKEILDIACNGSRLAIKNGKPIACRNIKCSECDLLSSDYECCIESVLKWTNAEYVEPEIDWSKVKKDSPIYVRNSIDDYWEKRYFNDYDKDYGLIYTFKQGRTSFSSFEGESFESWAYAKLAEKE